MTRNIDRPVKYSPISANGIPRIVENLNYNLNPNPVNQKILTMNGNSRKNDTSKIKQSNIYVWESVTFISDILSAVLIIIYWLFLLNIISFYKITNVFSIFSYSPVLNFLEKTTFISRTIFQCYSKILIFFFFFSNFPVAELCLRVPNPIQIEIRISDCNLIFERNSARSNFSQDNRQESDDEARGERWWCNSRKRGGWKRG